MQISPGANINAKNDPDVPTESPWPSVNQYSSLCRHYEGRYIGRPSAWPSSPFALTRVRQDGTYAVPPLKTVFQDAPRTYRNTIHQPLDTEEDPALLLADMWANMSDHDVEDVDATTLRIRSKDGIDIWMSPLVLPAMTQLLSDLSSGVRISKLSPQ